MELIDSFLNTAVVKEFEFWIDHELDEKNGCDADDCKAYLTIECVRRPGGEGMSCGVLKNRLSICVSNKTKFFILYDSKSIILLQGHFNPCFKSWSQGWGSCCQDTCVNIS